MVNVLVFPCGSEIGLEIYKCLEYSKHFKIYGASSVDDHGKFIYKNYIDNVPNIESEDFIARINDIIEEHNIKFIIPAHDSVVLKMSENQNKIKAYVLTSEARTCSICRSKKSTYHVFEPLLATPKIYTYDNAIFPVFLKPDVGQGSKGTYKPNTKEEIAFYLKKDPTLLILEYLAGREYTIDCFTNRLGVLLYCEGRERSRINNGISVNSKRVKDIRFKEMADIINKKLNLRGAWFFQVKENEGNLVLMEIAPRIAGTSGLNRIYGVNLVELSLFDAIGIDVEIQQNKYMDVIIDRALSSKFLITYDYEYIYMDFDDTLIVNSSVNIEMIKFIYDSKNKGKKIILLSRHRHNIDETLRKYCIDKRIFHGILIIKGHHEKKSSYITRNNSIFIDDSYAERKEVSITKGIPVFSLDAIGSLM